MGTANSDLAACLRSGLASLSADASVWVGFSGGLDSTALLYALRAEIDLARLRAVHVDHQLHAQSADWSAHCQRICAEWSVPLQVLRVQVDPQADSGPEAAARDARYRSIAECLDETDWLATAHHADDQLETLLMRLLRGTGPRGMAGMRPFTRLNGLRIWRPWLEIPRAQLLSYARDNDLSWLDDPSNLNREFDRNFLRHDVVPRLRQRWPAAASSAARTARRHAVADELLTELAAIDGNPGADALPVSVVAALSSSRALNLLRGFLSRRGVAPPTEAQLAEGLPQLLGAAIDKQPCLAWPGGQLRRYRGRIYLLEPRDAVLPNPEASYIWDGQGPIQLPAPSGTLSLERQGNGGLDPDRLADGIQVRFRRGAESIRPAGHAHRRALKKLFQEAGVFPWMRPHVPLLYVQGELVAVADLWTADQCAASPGESGLRVHWRPGAPIQ